MCHKVEDNISYFERVAFRETVDGKNAPNSPLRTMASHNHQAPIFFAFVKACTIEVWRHSGSPAAVTLTTEGFFLVSISNTFFYSGLK